MAIKLSGFAKITGMLYSDIATVYRYQKVENADGSTDTVLQAIPELTNVPCRVSFTRTFDEPWDVTQSSNPIHYAPTLFLPPDCGILAGDFVEVSRNTDNGETAILYKGNISQPAWYATHIEARINIDERA